MVVLVGAAAVITLWPKGASPSASAVLEARTLVAFAQSDSSAPLRSQLVISVGSDARPVGTLDSYSALAFSPDGKTLAALAGGTAQAEGARLHFVAADGSSEKIETIAQEASATVPIWSPNGANVAVIGAHTLLFSANGERVASIAAPALPSAVGIEHNSGGFAWSPDSQHFGVITNNTLLLISPGDEVVTQDLAPLGGGTGAPPVFLGWRGATAYVGISDPTSPQAWSFDIGTGHLTVAVVPNGQDLPVPAGLILASDETVSDVVDRVPHGTVVRAEPSADGNADIVEVLDAKGNLHVFVRDRISGAPFEVQGVPEETRGGALLDAYVDVPN